MNSCSVAILLFDEVEVLDFCGPFEVFSVTGTQRGEKPFTVFTVAEKSPITARNGLSVNPTYLLDEAPPFSMLLIPGGQGTRQEMHNKKVVSWIAQQAPKVDILMSVCTGALLLAKAGLLDNLKVTTHWKALDLLREVAPHSEVLANQRFIDHGNLILSAGISAGIDMSFHVVKKLLGHAVAKETAEYMEYDWKD